MPGEGLAALLVSVLAATSSPAGGGAVAGLVTGALPEVGTVVEKGVPELLDLAQGALPPPPTVVVLATKSYGQVTVDHRAHLKRRATCRGCHGPGALTKIGHFQPKVAHERCVGCHRAQEQRGPVKC